MSITHALLLPAVLAAGLLVAAAASAQAGEPKVIPPITVPGAPDAPPPPAPDRAAAPARPSSPTPSPTPAPSTTPAPSSPAAAAPRTARARTRAAAAPAVAEGRDGRFWPVFGGVALALLVSVAWGARRLVPTRSAFDGSRVGRWIEMALVSGMSFAVLCTVAAVVLGVALG